MQLTDHWWWRPGWRPGRRMWTWHVTFDGPAGAGLHRLAAAHRPLLSTPGLDVVPDRWLHLTTQGLGFTDEVDDATVEAVIAAARRRLAAVEAVDVVLGPPRVHRSGVVLDVAPAEPLHRVRAALRAATADVLGPGGVPGEAEGFRPHVTLAYSNGPGDGAALAAALRGVEPATARVTVAQVQLIRLGRDEHLYRWDEARTVVLGGG